MNNYDKTVYTDVEIAKKPDSLCAKSWFHNAVDLTKASALAVAITGSAFAQEAPVAEEASMTEDEDVKTYTVTGSRIKRIDLETPSPVLVITREDLDATGFSTVGDALRALPFASGQSLNSSDAGTSFTPGVSSVNLRGLGNNNTLALINGRRAALYPSPGFNGFQSVFDYNSIPISAIEAIEIQKDGGSAIYGSDAVAGTINLKLRRDFSGLQTQVSFGDYFDTGGFEKKFFAIAGASSEKTNMVFTFDFSETDAVFNRDLDYTDSADGSDIGGFDQSSSANVASNVRGLTPSLYLIDPAGDPDDPANQLFPSGRASIANVDSLGRPILVPFTDTLTLGQFEDGNKFYNYQEQAGLFPETTTFGFYASIDHQITDSLQAFGEVSYRRLEIESNAAPTPAFLISGIGDSAIGTINFPESNPYNVFSEDIVDLRWRMIESGNRINDLTIQYPRLVAGLRGDIGFDWSWESAVMYSKSDLSNLNRNSVQDQLLQDALNGVVIDGETLYANPFGTNDPRVIDYFTISNPNNDSYEVLIADVSASGVLYELPAGPLGIALGMEYREDTLESIGTILNETGQIVGGSEGTDTFGDRDVFSAYAELSIPILSTVEAQVAARYEDYSDFGDTTKPKVALKYRPTEWLLLRASYSEAFRAPDLPYLFSEQTTSFSSSFLPDPKRPSDPPNQVRQNTGGNPDLGPEETEVYYAGAILSPVDIPILEDFTFSVEYFQFDQTDLIDSLSASEALALEDNIPGLVVRNPPSAGESVGTIAFVNTNFQNVEEATYEGWDLGIKYIKETDNFGEFRASVEATYLSSYEFAGAELAGEDNYPEWRGTGNIAWRKGDWAASMYVYFIDEYKSVFDAFDIPPTEAQWVFNPQVSYSGFFDTKITVGVNNVFNTEPSRDKDETLTVNPAVNIIQPAFWYVRLTRDF
ncbi:MAG: TonB-dependent receptor [Verrucomicrobiota bacterium]